MILSSPCTDLQLVCCCQMAHQFFTMHGWSSVLMILHGIVLYDSIGWLAVRNIAHSSSSVIFIKVAGLADLPLIIASACFLVVDVSVRCCYGHHGTPHFLSANLLTQAAKLTSSCATVPSLKAPRTHAGRGPSRFIARSDLLSHRRALQPEQLCPVPSACLPHQCILRPMA